MMDNSDYRFERLTGRNAHLIRKLFRQVYNKDYPEEFFQKKYDTLGFNKSVTGYFAFNQAGEAVAYYGIFPCRALIKGQQVLIAQSGDSMTLSHHQRKGLFTRLAMMTYADAKAEGIHFVYGFPNRNSEHGLFDVLQWKREGRMLEFSKRIPVLPIAIISHRVKPFRIIYLAWKNVVLNFFKAGKQFPNPAGEFCVARDASFFNYKGYSDSCLINIGGRNIFLKEEGHLKIGDMEFSSEEELKAIWKRIVLLAFLLGTRKVIWIYSENHPYVPLLKKYFKHRQEGHYGHFNLSGVYDTAGMSYAFCDSDTF